MSLAVVGLSHHSSPIEVRERFAFSSSEAMAALTQLTDRGIAREAVLLSTCNRTEFYLRFGAETPGPDTIVELLARQAGFEAAEAARYIYSHRDRQGVEHLYRVVTSLDSMILGEVQIQGQVRSAYEQASGTAPGTRPAGPVLSRLFETALSVGGRVRSETTLGTGAASIPSAAVELARKIFGSLEGRRALVVGAGEMSELALESLLAEGVSAPAVVNRTAERGRELATKVGGRAIPFSEVDSALAASDIVITATAAPHPVLTREHVERAFQNGRRQPLLIVDIAIPRDVAPEAAEIENVFLYDIDDLRQIVDDNLERRRREVPVAERIIREAVESFWDWYTSREVVPLIRELRGQAEEYRQTEVEKALRRLKHLAPEDQDVVEQLTRQILNKVLHKPTVRLREAATIDSGVPVVHAARYLFQLNESPDSAADSASRADGGEDE